MSILRIRRGSAENRDTDRFPTRMDWKMIGADCKTVRMDRKLTRSGLEKVGIGSKTVHLGGKKFHTDRKKVGMDGRKVGLNRRAIHTTRKTNRATIPTYCAVIHVGFASSENAAEPEENFGNCALFPGKASPFRQQMVPVSRQTVQLLA